MVLRHVYSSISRSVGTLASFMHMQTARMPARCMSSSDRRYPGEPRVGVGVVILRPSTKTLGAEVRCTPVDMYLTPTLTTVLVQILLIKRGKSPSKGLWSFPGGSQELGEIHFANKSLTAICRHSKQLS